MKDKNNFINSGGNNNFNDINNNQVFALPMNAIDELGSLRSNNDIPTKTSNDSLRINITKNNNNIINDTNNNNMNDFNDINNTNKINMNNNISTITSLEDKLNGLTLKLSKLNESINNNKKNYQHIQILINFQCIVILIQKMKIIQMKIIRLSLI